MNIELNGFWALFNVWMNTQNLSPRASWDVVWQKDLAPCQNHDRRQHQSHYFHLHISDCSSKKNEYVVISRNIHFHNNFSNYLIFQITEPNTPGEVYSAGTKAIGAIDLNILDFVLISIQWVNDYVMQKLSITSCLHCEISFLDITHHYTVLTNTQIIEMPFMVQFAMPCLCCKMSRIS